MKDVNSPNDQVQWATDKTTINSISYKRACSTDLSSLHTLLLVVKTKDHIGLDDLHDTGDHRHVKCQIDIITGQYTGLIHGHKKTNVGGNLLEWL